MGKPLSTSRCCEQRRVSALMAWQPFLVLRRPSGRIDRYPCGIGPPQHLHLLAGHKGQANKLLGLFVAQLGGKAFDAVVGGGVAVRVDQVLVDDGGVGAKAQLGRNELTVDFAPAGRNERGSRWPGWGNLSGQGCRIVNGGRN